VARPGVYAFPQKPDEKTLLLHSGAMSNKEWSSGTDKEILLESGTKVTVKLTGQSVSILKEDMAASYKLTLGLPLSLNRETAEGLAAIPGVGPCLASAIVREREKRKGFRRVEDLLSVRGIGPATYGKIRPYLIL
jgi:competence protein ComEA